MQARFSLSSARKKKCAKRRRERERQGGREEGKVTSGGWGALEVRNLLATAVKETPWLRKGEDVRTNWIFASVTSFFANNSHLFPSRGTVVKATVSEKKRLYNSVSDRSPVLLYRTFQWQAFNNRIAKLEWFLYEWMSKELDRGQSLARFARLRLIDILCACTSTDIYRKDYLSSRLNAH